MQPNFPTHLLRPPSVPDREELEKLLTRVGDAHPAPQGEPRESWEDAFDELEGTSIE